MKNVNITILLIVLMCMFGVQIFAEDFAVKNSDGKTIYYNYNSDGSSVSVTYRGTSYSSYSNEYTGYVVIPETVTYNGKTYSVTSIGNYAFRGCSGLTSVTIPNSVTSIGFGAFWGCNALTSVTIPNSVTSIGSYAFSGCSGLTSVTIPNSVTSIGNSAFSGCSGLAEVTIPNSVTSIGSSAFHGCSGLTSVTIPNSVTIIGSDAFHGCSGLTSVAIPNSVTIIGSYAFSGCSGLTSVAIPNSVTSIGDYAFEFCSGLTSITIPNSVTSIGSSAFSGCSGLTKVIVKDIGAWCKMKFYDVSANPLYNAGHLYSDETTEITNLVIPDSVTTIENYTFSGSSELTSVTIPDSVESIGDNAFSGCTGISSITIPCNVSSIGSSAFAGCSNIRSVEWNAKNCNSSSNPFSDAPNILEFVVGKDVINIPDYLFYGMNNLRSLTIGAGVLTIGNQGGVTPAKVFWMPNTPPTGCNNVSGMVNYTSNDSFSQPNNSSSLQNIRICRYLSSIFEVDGVRYVLVSPSERTCNAIDCVYDSTLCEVNIDKTVGYKGINLQVKDINPYTFYSNTYIKKAYIDTDGELGAHAFENCNNMTVCTMGDRITKIDDYAFSGCKVLHRAGVDLAQEDADYNGVMVSKAVSHIGNYAFYECSAIKNVIMEDRKENDIQLTLGSSGSLPLFSSCPLDSVYIGRNISYSTLSSKGYSPFYRNTSLRTVHITDKETEISDNEFYGCTNLRRITIGDGVKKIGSYAFSGCSSLESFICGTRLETVGKEAFSDCTAMTTFKSKAVTPPTCGSQALDDINKWECTLHVPRPSIESYQGAEQWKEFFFVEAMPLEKGDVNGDYAITMADANAVVNYFLATDKPEDFNITSADVNGDGEVTMADANQIVNMFLSGTVVEPTNGSDAVVTDTINAHKAVDLGLSVKWATCNVGAENPQDYGDYFAWGETEPKGDYNWATYKWCNGSSHTLTKYNTNSSYGTVDNKNTLEPADDAATVNWGGSWRMPTYSEIMELKDSCYWEWTYYKNKTGFIIYKAKTKADRGIVRVDDSSTATTATYSLSDNHIFLPAEGYYSCFGNLNSAALYNAGVGAYYWSSSSEPGCSYDACGGFYYNEGRISIVGNFRSDGLSIRPVCP